MFAKWRLRAADNIREYGLALLMGMVTSVVATWFAVRFHAPDWAVGATTVLSDNIGFYGFLLVAHSKRIGSVPKAAQWLLKEYWLAELLDSWIRTGLVLLMALTTLATWLSAFTANRLADLCFFVVAVMTGSDLNNLLITGAKKVLRR